jgi:hypothetical protein
MEVGELILQAPAGAIEMAFGEMVERSPLCENDVSEDD